ncbi:DsbC family protein [Altericroceibacterium spongiae]|uniref:Thiol:disulfide interchange protein n=1 Tax=Altericroceibacterium spongiae TaxID=2320269 RepID=A0A420EAN1_9SPHN|nr:DsbC family protein [Altericroceibacterium spongiae]RKF17702.1 DsbC family protein [Altericroceibacterium spongiae]
MKKDFLVYCAIAGVTISIAAATAYAAPWQSSDRQNEALKEALAERLPKTEISRIDCSQINGVCEVQAKSNLFYTDESGRYLIIGRIYDLETRQDLTAARLLEMAPETLVDGAAKTARADTDEHRSMEAGQEIAEAKVSLTKLNEKGAINWGKGSHTVTIFSDFRCGYCQRLHQTLSDMNVRVVERPISILGSRAISEAVICAEDRQTALKKAYAGADLAGSRKCDTSGLDQNEGFARENGFTGTPVIVREDGAVLRGYRPKAFLEQWLEGKVS